MRGEVRITVTGWVGRSPELKKGQSGQWLTFSVGSTPGYFDRSAQAWVDQKTEWFKVTVSGTEFIDNVLHSINKSEPVTVSGRLRTHEYVTTEGKTRKDLIIVADRVGHDLRAGDARFHRYRPDDARTDQVDQARSRMALVPNLADGPGSGVDGGPGEAGGLGVDGGPSPVADGAEVGAAEYGAVAPDPWDAQEPPEDDLAADYPQQANT